MKNHNIQQASLLAASGELGPKATRRLQERMAADTDVLIEVEVAKSRFELLEQLPKVELTPLEKERLASTFKKAIHKKLKEQEKANRTPLRWKLFYSGLAGLSAAAAVAVVIGSLWLVQRDIDHRRAMSVTEAEQRVRDYLDTNRENLTDATIHGVDQQLQDLEKQQFTAERSAAPGAVLRLMQDVEEVKKDVVIPITTDVPGPS